MMKTKGKLLALLLAVVMLCTLLPTAALATEADVPAEKSGEAAPDYIQDIIWKRSKKADYPVYMRSDEFPYVQPFVFDPDVTEYDLVFPYMMGVKVDYAFGYVTFTDEAKADENVYSRVSVVYDIDAETGEEKTAFRWGYQAAEFPAEIGVTDDATGLGWTNGLIAKNGGMDAKYPPKVKIETGVPNSDDIETAVLEDAGPTYVFNYYRCAGFTTIKATYEDGSTALNLNYYTKGYPLLEDATNIPIDNVKYGTEKLDLTIALNSDSVLKVDDGTGAYVEGPTDKTFSLDLTKYGDAYKNEAGALVIPFMLDYDQEGTGSCAFDGYYTLTLNFEQPENSEPDPTPAAPLYVEDFSLTRNSAGNIIYEKSDEFPYVKFFEFDPEVTEYDLVFPFISGAMEISNLTGILQFTEEAKADPNVYARLSVVYRYDAETGADLPRFRYGDVAYGDVKVVGVYGNAGEAGLDVNNIIDNAILYNLDAERPAKFIIEVGVLSGDDIETGTLTGQTYTFNICRCASMTKFELYDGTEKLLKQSMSAQVIKYYNTAENFFNYVANDVRADATELTLNAATKANATFMLDNGTGIYEALPESGTLTLDLTKYGEEYRNEAGALVIPFMVDYTGDGATADGYYTLTLNFAQPETHYVKEIFIRDPLIDDHIYLDSFTPEQTSYALGQVPAYDASMPYFFLALEDEENYRDMRFSITLTDADGNVRSESDVPFKKTSMSGPNEVPNTYLYDYENGGFRLLNLVPKYGQGPGNIRTSFCEVPPGNYTLVLEIYEDGQKENAEVYTFTYEVVPFLLSLNAYADGKLIITDPDLRNPFYRDESYYQRRFIREFSANTQGSDEITLQLIVNNWLYNQYPGDESTGVSLLYNGEIIPAHHVFGDRGTTIDATLDVSGCEVNDGVYTVPFSLIYGEGANQVSSDFVIYATIGEPFDWAISSFSEGGTYDKGDTVTLSVEVEGERAGEVSYQWQWSDSGSSDLQGAFGEDDSSSVRGDIDGATEPSFTVPTINSGRRYYRCRVTDNATGAYEYTDVITIDVTPGELNDPVIIYQPGKYTGMSQVDQNHEMTMEYVEGERIDPIWIIAGPTDMLTEGVHLYVADTHIAWYYNSVPSVQGAQLLKEEDFRPGTQQYYTYYAYDGKTDFTEYVKGFYSTLNIGSLDIGDHYYFGIVTITDRENPENTASVTSEFLKITVGERGELEGFTGKGTNADPYLINDLNDLKRIDEYVMGGNSLEGCVFRMENDITLPADWEPIGKSGLPFGGTIDGNGKTITVEPGGRPLLEFARDAYVKDLNIYGEDIRGAGLLDKAGIDYGEDGEYQETDPDIITVENVTLLSGSRTTGSGLVNGGFTSGINNIYITNCTVEENVIVGYNGDQSSIGSFVGTLNGRVENSVSYATVRGVSNVGGLVGKKGQSIGSCEIVNSSFVGTIEASGGRVGGIIGAGYIQHDAANTPSVSVINCYVAANITGDSTPYIDSVYDYDMGGGIGGILGSEIGLRAPWDSAAIRDNHFYGTINDLNLDAATQYKRVGGILGELGGYDADVLSYENNYYLSSDNYSGFGYLVRPNAEWKPEEDSFIAKTAEAFADGTVTDLLNQGSYQNWVQGEAGYPVHSNAAVPSKLTVSGEYKTEYLLGDELDMSGAVFTVSYTDGTETTVDAAEITFSGFNGNERGTQTVTATYGPVSATFSVKVMLPPETEQITVWLTVMGDDLHNSDEDGQVHSLTGGGLQTWIANKSYSVSANACVKDVLEMAMTEAGITWTNETGTYITAVTRNGVTLGEKTNGVNSGWMYTLNGEYPLLDISAQYLNDGDAIVFHYTDDYTKDFNDEPSNPSGGGGGGGGGTAPATPAQSDKPTFDDVADDAWYAEAVAYVVEKGLMNGTDETTFEPETPISRAMIAVILYRLAGQPEASGSNPFSDVKDGMWYTDAVIWAAECGLVNGYGDGVFGINDDLTREQFATILYRYVQTTGGGFTGLWDFALDFEDVGDVSDWANEAMHWCVMNGIINGRTETTLVPGGNAKRAEAAMILMRFCEAIAD